MMLYKYCFVAYRGHIVRKKYGPLINKDSGQIDDDTAKFIRPFAKKWKNKSMFQVLLQYRSAKFQDLINLSQQVYSGETSSNCKMHSVFYNYDLYDVDSYFQSNVYVRITTVY